ncbi:MAG TPA: hypothetical protein PKD19_00315 [Candidatus Saccharibacteria bacterium]|jgi:hypothetical protein|nr:hypothetical protein [Candidatus Saccharibacteria bacterium]HMR38144.1 hypothetical protein [Candidatus Saccharibacteria bacterium]
MTKELVDPSVDRRNILNNSFAMSELQDQIGVKGTLFDVLTLKMKPFTSGKGSLRVTWMSPAK